MRPRAPGPLGCRGAVLACLLLAAGPRASSQALDPGKALTQYHVDTWTTADNLPQNSVTAILQSRDGYLWLGTYGGVGRFDGVRFATFDTANTPELLSNGIQALLEDGEGRFWLSGNKGISRVAKADLLALARGERASISPVFHVIASNPDGVWNEAGAKVELSARPFFWETRWFYALIALGAGLGGFGTFRLRVRQLREHKRELEALVAVRTRDLLAEKERSEAARAEAERQNELAQEADRQKGELLSIAAHDLKTPLQTIIGYAEMMAERPGLPEASEYAERTAQAARRMVEIINRLLEGEAIARGGMPLSRGIVDVGRLAQAMVLSLQPQAGTKKQRIHAEVEPSCLVNGDEDWLRQVLENLIGNAIKYSPERRSIWLSVRRNGGTVVIEVRDEGPGLTEDDKAKLFGRFQRLSARPTGGEIATGLGLSIVKQLVALHEGRVWAESAGPDQGTRFYVELPSRDG